MSKEVKELNKSGTSSSGYSPRQEPLQQPSDPTSFSTTSIKTEIIRYYVLYGIITILGLILILMTAFWVVKYNGRLCDFINLHILLSVIGFIFLNTQGILAFRTIRYITKSNSPKTNWKASIAHTVIQLLSVVISCSSMVMAFMSHGATIPPSKDMYTLHAWIGIVTFVLFCLLWLVSLLFFFPRMMPSIIKWFLRAHVALGMALFFLIVSSCLSGFMEQIMWMLGNSYEELPQAGVMVNCIGCLIIVYCGFVVFAMQTVKDI